jgi:hypothetical protein
LRKAPNGANGFPGISVSGHRPTLRSHWIFSASANSPNSACSKRGLLSMLANKAKALVEKQGKLMLEKPVKPSTT